MNQTAAEAFTDRLNRLERTIRWQKRSLLALACTLGCLGLYVVNVIRPWDNIHVDSVETGYIKTTAVKFVGHELEEPLAYFSTWPSVESELPEASPDRHTFRPQLMLRDPKWTRRLAVDLRGDMPAIAFYNRDGELKAVLSVTADGPHLVLQDSNGHVVFSTGGEGPA